MNVQRKHERYAYELDVAIVFEDGEKHDARMINFSLGGAFVTIDPQPRFGSKIKLLIDLPGVPERCEISSFVRWTREGEGIGIQFEYTRPIEVWALSKLIRRIKDDTEGGK